jgi:peptidoglycan hydrolase-like protein with peptidoglycan-binding domain
MHSVDTLPRHAPGGPDCNAEDTLLDGINRTTHQIGPVEARATIPAQAWVVGIIVVFLISFAAARWLPDLMTNAREGVSKPPAETSTSTSAIRKVALEQPDDDRIVTPNPLIPIVIRRSTPPDAEMPDLQARTEPPPVTVPNSADTIKTPQQLDLREVEDAKRVQQRLIELGFLFGVADGRWGPRSRQALQEFKGANGIGDSDTWDEATQERLLTAPDAKAARTSDISFVGAWGVNAEECGKSPVKVTARRAADAFGASCEFRSTERESSNVWRVRALCTNEGEHWNANIRFTLSGSKLTWSSERGTTTYLRCPS